MASRKGGVKSTSGYGGGREHTNLGRGTRSGDKSNPLSGKADKGTKAIGTSSQSSNTPKTANPKTVEKPGKVTFGQYGGSGKKRRP